MPALHHPRYFQHMALLLLALVLLGFGSEFFRRSSDGLLEIPLRLHAHGIVLLAWFVGFVLQTQLVGRGHTRAHQRLGVFAAAVGCACIIAAPLATLGAVRSLHALGLAWESNLQAYPTLGIESLSMGEYATFLVLGNCASVISFAVLLLAALMLRRRGDFHSRLMLLASLTLMSPAIARLARWPIFGGEDGALIPLAMFLLFVSLPLQDWRHGRRLHPATLWGSAFVALATGGALLFATTPVAESFVRSMG